jgi:hypothetical protein
MESRYTGVCSGASGYSGIHPGIPRYVRVYLGMPRYTIYLGSSGCVRVCTAMSRYTRACLSIPGRTGYARGRDCSGYWYAEKRSRIQHLLFFVARWAGAKVVFSILKGEFQSFIRSAVMFGTTVLVRGARHDIL